MKIKLIIASGDEHYINHLSDVLAEDYSEFFDVRICSSVDSMQNLVAKNKYDILLLEASFVDYLDGDLTKNAVLLYDNFEGEEVDMDIVKIHKYQRISSMVGKILEYGADLNLNLNTKAFDNNAARCSVFWSPCGGTGKTTVALAYATRKALEGKDVLYVNLERFASTEIYFKEPAKSVSNIFQRLDSNLDLVVKSAKQKDSGTGISYFGVPENYDDIDAIEVDDIKTFLKACVDNSDEVVIDISSLCNKKTKAVFDMVDRIFIVCDNSESSRIKLNQFVGQHYIWAEISHKVSVVGNKGCKNNLGVDQISLPMVKSSNEINVFKTLSAENFER